MTCNSNRGFFEIGVYQPKTSMNIGTLYRSAYQLGASGIFTIGERFIHQPSDTIKTYRHIPYRKYTTFKEFKDTLPYSTPIIAVETGGKDLRDYKHLQRCIYLLGSEDNGLPRDVLVQCHCKITIPSMRSESYNVAMAGTIVMYDRVYGQKLQVSM
jgi:tRNA G18 (ribose-2'-O)-methylase SpoU